MHADGGSRLTGVPAVGLKHKNIIQSTGPATVLKDRAARLLEERRRLPVYQQSGQIQQSLRFKDVLLVVGETGSGKSTQVPQVLLDEAWCEPGTRIAVTQPRRVAAISLATRVAAEMATSVGFKDKRSTVGYSVRFDKNYGPATRIKYLTEGTLLQEMATDPHLNEYSCVIVDEVHERSLNVDVILGHLRDILTGDLQCRKGKRLKVVVMSATLNVNKIYRFFASAYAARKLTAESTHDPVEDLAGIGPADTTKAVSDPDRGGAAGVEKRGPASTSTNSETGSQSKAKKRKRNDTDAMRLLVNKLDMPQPSSRHDSLRSDVSDGTKTDEHESSVLQGSSDMNSFDLPNIAGGERIALLRVEGRMYDVSVSFADEDVEKVDRPDRALEMIFSINYKERFPGDILVFLPGQEEIESLENKILQLRAQLTTSAPQLEPLPLFAQLPPEQQARVFQPPPPRTRKVVLSTNIAETSLTIPGIRYVVDTGLFKEKRFRPDLGLDSLLTTDTSQSSAMQRAGRAGREAPGKCFRIYTQQSWDQMVIEAEPEIKRCDLARALLGIVQTIGNIEQAMKFSYVDPPSVSMVRNALFQILRHRGLTNTGIISEDGKHMAHLPLSIPLARILLTAMHDGPSFLEDAIDMIAGLSVERMFLEVKEEDAKEDVEDARKEITVRSSDHLTLMMAVRCYVREDSDRMAWCRRRAMNHRAMRNATQVRKQLRLHFRERRLLPASIQPAAATSSRELTMENKSRLLRYILRGMVGHAARKQHDTYQTVEMSQTASIHPSSVLSGLTIGLRPTIVVYHELVFTGRNYMRVISAVEESWYSEISSD